MSYVYAIRIGDWLKIGTTYDLHRRFDEINSRHKSVRVPADLCGDDARLAGWLSGGRTVERAILLAFEPYRGELPEWFHWNDHLDWWCSKLPYHRMPRHPSDTSPVVF